MGDRPTELDLNLSQNTYSSSLLPVNAIGVRAAPKSAYIGREMVPVVRLDSWAATAGIQGRMFLKIDTQGYELKVLQGATDILPLIHGMLVECSLTPQYEGQPLLHEIMEFLHRWHFQVIDILPGLRDPTSGRFLGLDVLAKRVRPA